MLYDSNKITIEPTIPVPGLKVNIAPQRGMFVDKCSVTLTSTRRETIQLFPICGDLNNDRDAFENHILLNLINEQSEDSHWNQHLPAIKVLLVLQF